MATLTEKLERKALDDEQEAQRLLNRARTIRELMAEFNGTAIESVQRRFSQTLDAAMQIDAVRANGNGHAPKAPRGSWIAKSIAKRTATAEMLAQFDTRKPSAPPEGMKAQRLNPLVNTGYLVRKGGGYLRTAKPFSIHKPQSAAAKPRKPKPSDMKLAAARDEKARIIATILKEHGPMNARELAEHAKKRINVGPTGLTGIYAYVRRGYISQHKVKGAKPRDGFTYTFKTMPPEASV